MSELKLLRQYKRKQAQAMAFRSFNGLKYLCESLGVIDSLRQQGGNLFKNVASIFDRRLNNTS